MPSRFPIEGWPQGMNNLLRADSLPIDTLRRCTNFDLDDAGKISVRKGSSRIYAGAIQRGSLGSTPDRTLFVEGGHLKELVQQPDDSYAAMLIRLNVGAHPMQYLALNGEIYYTNGLITGKLDKDGRDLPWGIKGPGTQPNLHQGVSGSLIAGTYQVAVTFLSETGEESGTGLAAQITVTADNSSIIIKDFPPAPAYVQSIAIYISHADGEGLYRIARIPAASTQYEIDAESNIASFRMRTQFGMPPPPGDIIEYHDGRIYIANDKVLWFTEPLRYGLVKPMQGYVQFPKRITVVKAVEDGLYVCSDKTYWFTGANDPDMKEVLPYGGIYNTGIDIPNFDAVAWFSTKGLVVAGLDGDVLNVMQDRVGVSEHNSGTMMFREHKGIRQIVADLWGGELTTYAAPDYVALEVARGGEFI